MLLLDSLSIGYPDAEPLLKNINLSLFVPGVYALLWPSGAGKTTLLKTLAGVLPPAGGRFSGLSGFRSALLFQENRLLPWRSALMNVAIAEEDGNASDAEALLRKLDIENIHEKPAKLSGGMQRRVALARLLARKANCLLLDEPFNGMDRELRARIIPALLENASFILFSTHDPDDLVLMNAQPIVLERGNLYLGEQSL